MVPHRDTFSRTIYGLTVKPVASEMRSPMAPPAKQVLPENVTLGGGLPTNRGPLWIWMTGRVRSPSGPPALVAETTTVPAEADYSPVDEEITRLIGELCATEPPLAGSWLITLPAATELLVC